MLEVKIEEENKEILRRYRKLLRHAKPILKDKDAKKIKKAFLVALEAHKDVRRKSGEPYIYHPLEVADICVNEIGLGMTSIISALLHDVVEDTQWELSGIKREFGTKIMRIIDGLTKMAQLPQSNDSTQAENFQKILLTLATDTRVILIKLADRLDNMRTLQYMSRENQLKTSSETLDNYVPLAHRLGLYAIKTELEDLAMKYIDTNRYQHITDRIESTKEDRNKFIRSFVRPIQRKVKTLGYKVEIKGREKSIYSIDQKMKKQSIPFEEVYDLFAIRIIIDRPLDNEKFACWNVYSIVTDLYRPNPSRLRDWVSMPKANGYESLHTTVMTKSGQWVEVQIRTRKMDDIAEKGYAAHWKYKNSAKEKESTLDIWLDKIRESLEQKDFSATEFVNDFKANLYQKEIYTFTPKGDFIILPKASTALDFAFNIHSEVGAHCIGAKINRKLVAINTRLKNGDQIEVITSSKQKPHEDWLRFVVSNKAITHIKTLLKEEKKEWAKQGREIASRKLKQIKRTINEETTHRMLAYFSYKNALDFFSDLGKGKIQAKEIKKISEVKPRKKNLKPITPNPASKPTEDHKDILMIGDGVNMAYKFAPCCKPIPGDTVFGFITIGEGVKIHRTTCPNATELMASYGYRIIKAKWTSQQKIAFLAGFRLVGTDRIGIINDITQILSKDLKTNIQSFTMSDEQGVFEGHIKVYVNDTKHLNHIISKLKKIEGIERVGRHD